MPSLHLKVIKTEELIDQALKIKNSLENEYERLGGKINDRIKSAAEKRLESECIKVV